MINIFLSTSSCYVSGYDMFYYEIYINLLNIYFTYEIVGNIRIITSVFKFFFSHTNYSGVLYIYNKIF